MTAPPRRVRAGKIRTFNFMVRVVERCAEEHEKSRVYIPALYMPEWEASIGAVILYTPY